MSDWRSLKMAAVMEEFYDGPHATPPPADDGPVYLGIKNITDAGLLDLTDVRHIAEDNFARWTKRVMPRPGDIVFTYEATLHRYALIPDGFRGCLGRRLALIRPDRSVVHPRFLHFAMLGPDWRATVTERVISGSTVDRVPILTFPDFPISIPTLDIQARIAEVLGSIDDLIENNRLRVDTLEQMARAIYREWFVRFRYPGHEDVPLVDSPFGPLPDGWSVRPLKEVAVSVASGPFGSRLGRKDYVVDGVPVIRGTNLRVGGGFDESAFVFVTPEKAAELSSSLAFRGDVVITQRGTLGQIGLIPEASGHALYVLSQSQMKVTIDSTVAGAEFVYRQMSAPDTTARFISHAMSTGVPHVNLALLRDFELMFPPPDLQHQFGDAVRDLDRTAWVLRWQTEVLSKLRDLLLPKLVTGMIEVSHLDLDALTEEARA